MSLITNAQIAGDAGWVNQRARTLADQCTAFLAKLKAYQADYAAQGVLAAMTGDAGYSAGAGFVDDGSAIGGRKNPTDSRQAVTGLTIANFKACVDAMVTALDVTVVAGVGSPPSTTFNAIQVNGSPR